MKVHEMNLQPKYFDFIKDGLSESSFDFMMRRDDQFSLGILLSLRNLMTKNLRQR